MTKSYLVQAAALAHSRPYDQGLRHGAQRTSEAIDLVTTMLNNSWSRNRRRLEKLAQSYGL